MHMTKFIERIGASLTLRMTLGTAVMLVPLVALGLGSLFTSQSMINALEEVARTEARELRPVIDLQKYVLQAAMPPNDYLILRNASEADLFDHLAREIDRRFTDMRASAAFEEQNEWNYIEAAAEEWEKARQVGMEILAVSRPAADTAAASRMKVFDAHIGNSADILTLLYDEVQHEIIKQQDHARAVKSRQTLLLIAVFVGALVIAAATGLLLSRSIILPIRDLQEGVSRFSEGDHSFRVVLDRQDEFGRLASTLNLMAGRLEYDGLTGVTSRQEFERLLRSEAERSSRYGHVLSLLMLDLDHFKQVNDTYGHPGGDEALRAFAKRVQQDLRSPDCIARYGGEEFAVIMPETGADAARNVAERIRTAIAARPLLSLNGRELTITVSVGTATFPQDARTEDDLIAAADRALYAAKASGRDRVVSYHLLTGPGLPDGT
jgi:diguanylate cyclase (GGDEF)-like protein